MKSDTGQNPPSPARLIERHRQRFAEAGFETIAAHFGEDRAGQKGAAAPPIYQASTFVYPNAAAFESRLAGDSPYYDYTRVGNPTTAILEAKLARLERGEWARCFASGMGAVSACVNACVFAGAHVVATGQCYWPARTYLREYMNRFGVEVTFVEGVAVADFEAALRPNTKLLYLESPTSGMMEVPEIAPLTRLARGRGITTVFDNSWASPYFQNPLEAGVDLVLHSATKYLGGHSDLVAGAVMGRDAQLCAKINREAELVGATIDPFCAWLMLRGLRTLALRMEQHQRSGLRIAEFLAEHPAVARVNHPGLPSHPQHAVARRQLRGFGGLFSVQLREQSREATHRVMDALRLFSIGVSWGGHESLVVGGNFLGGAGQAPVWALRLHVGLESTDDLIADLKQALERK